MKSVKLLILILPFIIFSCKIHKSKNLKRFEKINNKIYFNFNKHNPFEQCQPIIEQNPRKLLLTLPSSEYFKNFTNNVFFKVAKKDILDFYNEIYILRGKKSGARLKIKRIKANNELEKIFKLKQIRICIYDIDDEEEFTKFLNKFKKRSHKYNKTEIENYLKSELKKTKKNLVKAGFSVLLGPILWIPIILIPLIGIFIFSVGTVSGYVSLGFEIYNYKCTKEKINEFLEVSFD